MSSISPHNQLRACREHRGLTQHQAADRLVRVAWMRRGRRVGVNADMVSKWERGEKCPSPFYRELLCLLYQRTPDQLGVAVERPGRLDLPAGDGEDLSSTLLEALSLIDQLGPAGQVLQPKMFMIWKEELVKRRTMLKLLGLLPGAAALDTYGSAPDPAAEPRSQVNIETLDDLVIQYHRLYHSASPPALMAPVLAHLATVGDLLTVASGDDKIRRRILHNRSRVALLAGRLSFFDLHDTMAARGYYNLALDTAREAKDHLLVAAALGHTSFIPAGEHNFLAAAEYLQAAQRHVDQLPHPPLRSWLSAIEAEVHTNAGNETAALQAVEQATTDLQKPAPTLNWFDYYDRTRLGGFAGYTYLHFGRLAEASDALTTALVELPRQAVKQRAIFLADLATVHVHAHDIDQACAIAGQAADALAHAGYATGTERLRAVQSLVRPYNNHPAVRALEDQLAAH